MQRAASPARSSEREGPRLADIEAPVATAPPTSSDDAPRPRRRFPWQRVLPLVAVVVALAVYGGYRVHLSRRPYAWSGTVEARTISIGSRTGGRVRAVLVREAARVTQGQPLVILEEGDLDAQRLAAEGQSNEAKAALEKAKRGARPEEIAQAQARAATAAAALLESRRGPRPEELAQARALLAAAEAQADKAHLDATREHRLLAAGAVAQAEVDAADTAERTTDAERDARRHALEELENGTRREDLAQATARAREALAGAKLAEAGSRAEDIEAAEGAVTAAEGRLRQVQVMLDELTIRAPRDARVETLDLRPGDLLAPDAPAAVLVEDDQLYVRIYVPETQLGHVAPGQSVPVFVDSFPGRAFPGTVEHINAVGEYSPRNLQTADERANQVFAARVELGDGQSVLRAGMAAFIQVPR